MSETKLRMRAALAAMRKTGKRDLGLHLFLILFCLIVLAVAIPLALLLLYLPDWVWYPLGAGALIWMFFGETIAAGYQAFRGDRP